ncbi:VOC family protein [Arsenicicoccus dermatophilus]|uniref:VOC family protein n=1 Tax=Arsenicicoccus dermatophilus TaxID=1076331 RepID=UPI003916E450
MTLFSNPQIVLFVRDIERALAFYSVIGFTEVYRVPDVPGQEPVHVDLELDGYRLGLATEETTRLDHGLDPVTTGQRAAVILWTHDAGAAYARLADLGATPVHPPHPFLDRLVIAWAEDPEGHPIQVVQAVSVNAD